MYTAEKLNTTKTDSVITVCENMLCIILYSNLRLSYLENYVFILISIIEFIKLNLFC